MRISVIAVAVNRPSDCGIRYSFAELPDGDYSIEAALTGFVSVSYKPVRIYFPAKLGWNFVLSHTGAGGDAVCGSSELVGESR